MIIYLQTIDNPSDKAKFEQVYLHYRAFMYQVAYRILENQQDAEDAVHNAFLSIAKHIDDIEAPKSLRTRSYVYVIVERKAIDLHRKRTEHECEEFNEDELDITYTPSGEDDLMRCIMKLPPRYREVILLKYSHGYSTKEVAELLGISPETASKLDQRAKKKLEEICREEGVT